MSKLFTIKSAYPLQNKFLPENQYFEKIEDASNVLQSIVNCEQSILEKSFGTTKIQMDAEVVLITVKDHVNDIAHNIICCVVLYYRVMGYVAVRENDTSTPIVYNAIYLHQDDNHIFNNNRKNEMNILTKKINGSVFNK